MYNGKAKYPGYRLWAGVVLVLGLAVRLFSFHERSFWLDELWTRDIARLPFWLPGAMTASLPSRHSIIAFCVQDFGPGPATYILEGLFARWAEPLGGEFWLRIPGVAAGAATIALVLLYGRAWVGGAAGVLMFGLIAALAPAWVDFSTGARGYGWAIVFTVLLLHLLHGLSRIRAERLLPQWAAFCFVAAIGVMLHPFHVIVTGGMFAAAAWSRGAALLRRLRPVPFYALLLLSWALQLGWIVLWLAKLPPRSVPGIASGGPLDDFVIRFLRNYTQLPEIRNSLGLWLAVVLSYAAIEHRRGKSRPVLLAVLFVSLGNVVLACMLAARSHWEERYFYGLFVAGAWAAATLVQRAEAWVRARAGYLRIAWLRTALMLAAAAVLWQPALRRSSAPAHDWAGAVLWLKGHAKPTDIVVVGPNGDDRMYRAYASKLNLPAATTTIADRSGRHLDLATIAGFAEAIRSGRRVWFLSPYWGFSSDTRYWKYLQVRLCKVAEIPGKGAILIALHDPATQAGLLSSKPINAF